MHWILTISCKTLLSAKITDFVILILNYVNEAIKYNNKHYFSSIMIKADGDVSALESQTFCPFEQDSKLTTDEAGYVTGPNGKSCALAKQFSGLCDMQSVN